jgi:hypothetical protein
VTDDQLTEQIMELNQGYRPAKVGFTIAETIRCSGTALKEYQTNCNSGTSNFDNDCFPYLKSVAYTLQKSGILTFVGPSDGDTLGIAGSIGLSNDPPYVYIKEGTVPGGTRKDYDQGKTLTHENGHIFGLSHTFQNGRQNVFFLLFCISKFRFPTSIDNLTKHRITAGCSTPGDGKSDTPYQNTKSSGCPVGADTCPGQPGLDPINNFMDYSHDCCMYVFSPQQILTIQSNIQTNRPSWLLA